MNYYIAVFSLAAQNKILLSSYISRKIHQQSEFLLITSECGRGGGGGSLSVSDMTSAAASPHRRCMKIIIYLPCLILSSVIE